MGKGNAEKGVLKKKKLGKKEWWPTNRDGLRKKEPPKAKARSDRLRKKSDKRDSYKKADRVVLRKQRKNDDHHNEKHRGLREEDIASGGRMTGMKRVKRGGEN